MSLTSELKDPKSRVSAFMRERLPNTRRVMALSRGRMGERPARRPAKPVPWSLIGTALDYRLRFYFPQDGLKGGLENLICYAGAARACGTRVSNAEDDEVRGLIPPPAQLPGRLSYELMLDFFASLAECLRVIPPQRRLDATDEDRLLRHCVVMAALDVFARAGFDARSVLLIPEPRRTVCELLAVAEQEWLDDLRELSWDFEQGFAALWTLPAALNPTFDGSGFVGGADADLISAGCLIEVKTTINPLKDADWIYQLVGYALLDWHDAYHIEKVAVYFARQAYLLEWEVSDLLAELAGSPGVTLGALRADWHDLLARRAFGDGIPDPRFAAHMGYVMDAGRWRRWCADDGPVPE